MYIYYIDNIYIYICYRHSCTHMHYFLNYSFFIFLYFLTVVQSFHIRYFTNVLGIILMINSLRKVCTAGPLLLEPFWDILGLVFVWVYFSIS